MSDCSSKKDNFSLSKKDERHGSGHYNFSVQEKYKAGQEE